jgi:hypothetical protein
MNSGTPVGWSWLFTSSQIVVDRQRQFMQRYLVALVVTALFGSVLTLSAILLSGGDKPPPTTVLDICHDTCEEYNMGPVLVESYDGWECLCSPGVFL